MYPNKKYLVKQGVDIVEGIHGGDVNVLSQTILRRKLKLLNYAKLGQFRNFFRLLQK